MLKPRTIITTDMECDDMNSLIHLCLFLNEIDVDGFIYTSSKFHFNGDGRHTLGEVTPHYRCSGNMAIYGHQGYPHPDPEAKDLTSYRPFETGWIESLWNNEYRQAYPCLSSNANGYPTPEELLEKTCYGNIEFEGDVRFDTDGSNLIKKAILDEDERTLYLQSWGGANTIVRALMSIANDYKDTDQWKEIQTKVTEKVRILGIINGIGQDNSWLDYGKPLFPDLVLLKTENTYGSYFASLTSQTDCKETFQAEWLKQHIKFNHGPLMSKYGLMGDGTYYPGEPDRNQYGLYPTIDWGFDGMKPVTFPSYDFLGEGDSNTYIPLLTFGLRTLEDPSFGSLLGRITTDGNDVPLTYDWFTGRQGHPNRFLKMYQEEWAARADWCCKPYKDCAHPPVVKTDVADIKAAAGETVPLHVEVECEDAYTVYWEVQQELSTYTGTCALRCFEPSQQVTYFTIPQNAQLHDSFIVLCTVKSNSHTPMTRYAQIRIQVVSTDVDMTENNPLKGIGY